MTDDLRTRIAKAIADAQFAFDEGEPYNGPEDAEVLADAVIRELDLAKACKSGCVWQIPNHIENMTDAQKELLKRADDE